MYPNKDASIDELLLKINELRQELLRAVVKGLADDEVIKRSQELDVYIVEVQRKLANRER
ncbi:aspartyl-phosphate phosphatase Spo0E family protein [Paenibacillus popilliae]|uniref:FOG: CheY-like receiver n=1 Tax=Paenibacillus popilliae ATCC 14706 TaxID=1212764 RepID=M9LR96_PAEPP|nr:aspartyl-phosphate phosphatase Spo0E family protein [Paenibacillus popilliae]GAC43781.1 FOG: CheY-like receiver [Paenibacillus popilliae ATCC 14706]